MRIVFRADASWCIGSGHVMRCLTLAEQLRREGDEVIFISRTHPGHLHESILASGFELLELPAPRVTRGTTSAGRKVYADWLGTGQREDAAETIHLMAGRKPVDWLVVDNYSLDRDWESQLRPYTGSIAVIDDLADRQHDVDLLIDPLLGRGLHEYNSLLPAQCQTLLGPAFAPLRSEFARLRTTRKPDRSPSPRLLINFGGADPHGATQMVLTGLRGADLPRDLSMDVILGSNTEAMPEVKKALQALPYEVIGLDGCVTDLAQRMQAANLAVGAAGMSSWERCCLSLPAVIITIAANQHRIAAALHAAGAAEWLGNLKEVDANPELVGAAVADLLNDRSRYSKMVKAAAEISDGNGAERITAALHMKRIGYRRE